MARPRNPEPSFPLHVKLPETLVMEVKTILLDPITGRTKYGAMNSLIERLLREWLRSIKSGREDLPSVQSMEEEEALNAQL